MTIQSPDFDLILYPGTFDPPHLGHLAVVHSLLQRFPKAELQIVPSFAPVSAGGLAKKPAVTFSQRCEMVQLGFAEELKSSRVSVNLVEELLEPPVFSIKTVKALEIMWRKGCRVGFVVGQDQVKVFDRWYEPSAILQKVSLVVVTRGKDTDLRTETDAMLRRLPKTFVASEAGWHLDGGQWIVPLLGVDAPQSSTAIRKGLKAGESPGPSEVRPQVAAYIKKNALYL